MAILPAKVVVRFKAMRRMAAAAVAAILIYAGLANQRHMDAVVRVERALELGRSLERLNVAILAEESSVRAYQITGDRRFVDDLNPSRAAYNSTLSKIQQLSRYLPSQVERSERLARLGEEKHAWMQNLVELCAQGKHEEATARVQSGRGLALMAEIQRLVSAMNDEERDRLRIQESDRARARTQMDAAFAALCALLLACYITIRRQSKALVRAANDVAERELHYRVLFEHASDLVRLHTREGRTFFVSPSVETLLGYAPAELMAMAPSEFIHPDDLEPALESLERVLDGKVQKSVSSYRLRRKNGEYRWFEVHVQRVTNADGSCHGQSSARDITARRELEQRLAKQAEELRDLSLQDAVTGLYNRRGLLESSKQVLRAAVREKQAAAVLFVDLDGLKLVNDRLGHEAGDRFICEAAAVLQATCRASDIVARVGGDEFVVLAPHVGPDPDILKSRLERAAAELNANPGREYELSFSTGLALFDPLAPVPLDDLLKTADSRMYDAKVARRRQRRAQSSVTDPRQLTPKTSSSQAAMSRPVE